MPAALTIALRVDGAIDRLDPTAALLELTEPFGRQLLAHLDQVAQLRAEEPDVLSVDRTAYHLTWLADADPPLDQWELRHHDWAQLEARRLTAILDAVRRDSALKADVDGPVLVCQADRLSWRCYPRHSDADDFFTTPDLRRDTLVELLARLR